MNEKDMVAAGVIRDSLTVMGEQHMVVAAMIRGQDPREKSAFLEYHPLGETEHKGLLLKCHNSILVN